MDRHDIPGETAAAVASAHQQDLKIQHEFGCRAITYWFDERRGTAFCLIEAPDRDAVRQMHDAAHGLVPHEIIEVHSQVVETFLGRITDPAAPEGIPAAGPIINEPADRTVYFLDGRSIPGASASGPSGQGTTDWRKTAEAAVLRFAGRIVESGRRELLAVFDQPSAALDCATHTLLLPDMLPDIQHPEPRTVRIGIASGEPFAHDSVLFRDTVVCARRLSLIAPGGHALLSPAFKDMAACRDAAARGSGRLTVLREGELAFMHTVLDVSERMWNNPQVRVADYGRELGMSRSQAYRRITALTGRSPAEFLREYRLNKARELIEQRRGTISEAAYEAGFNSPSYFSKCFKRTFGVLPSEYADSGF